MNDTSFNFVGRISQFFIRRYRITWLVSVGVLLLGVFSFFSLPREQSPEINVPFVSVTTFYSGASPQDVEREVTDPLESKISELSDIEQITSTSQFSVSSVMVEFTTDVDADVMVQRLQTKVSEAVGSFPDDVETPVVTKIEITDIPSITVSLVGDSLSMESLTNSAEYLQDELEKLSAVSEVRLSGELTREIHVDLNPVLMANYGIDVNQVQQLFGAENLNLPVGEIEIAGERYLVRVLGEFDSLQTIESLVLVASGDALVRLGDVGTVSWAYDEDRSLATLSQFTESGWTSQSAVVLSVYKRKGDNLVEMAEEVRQLLLAEESSLSTQGIELVITGDAALDTQKEVNGLLVNVILSVLIVAVILVVFLGGIPALIASTVIPLSMGMALVVLGSLGFTLNGLTLFALILALGMLVDNGIVMVENIYRSIQDAPHRSPFEAAAVAANEIAIPLISAVLTTISAFLPMVFMTGISGQYVRVIPLTVIFCLTASLLIGLILVPYFSARFIHVKQQNESSSSRFDRLLLWYRNFLSDVLDRPRFRKRFLRALTLLFFISFALPISGLLRVEMFPRSDSTRIVMNVQMPPGFSLEKTERASAEVVDHLIALDGISNFVMMVGGSGDDHFSASINLVEREERSNSSAELIELIKAVSSPALIGAEFSFMEDTGGPPSDAPIVFRVQGDELSVLQDLAMDLASRLDAIPGTTEVDNGIEAVSKEYQIVLDREKLSEFGLSTFQVASTLRTLQQGTTMGVYRDGGEEFDVILKMEEGTFESFDDFEEIQFNSPVGLIPFNSVASVQLGGGLSSIQHTDLQKVITVSSELEPGANSREVLQQFQEEIETMTLPSGYVLDFGGEDADVQESFSSLYKAMWVAVLLIYLILIAQFNSYLQPFMILLTLPLAMIGVFWGLFFTGYSFSFPSFIGMVALAGIVVNNAILIIDFINQRRREGADLKQAVLDGVQFRFRPILLTTLTTVLGIIPTSLTDEVWGSLGFSVVFGLSFSTVLTLAVIPILYYGWEKKAM